jgi:Sec-independent protein secretion pathway component TatC
VKADRILKADRIYHTLYRKCTKLIVKYFLLADILFFGGSSYFWKHSFPLADKFYFGGHLGLESSCIRVHTVLNCITNQNNSLKLHNLGTFLIPIVVLLVKTISLEKIFDLIKTKV